MTMSFEKVKISKQLLITLIISNIVLYIFMHIVFFVHNHFELKFVKQTTNIAREKNVVSSKSKFSNFMKNQKRLDFDLYYYNKKENIVNSKYLYSISFEKVLKLVTSLDVGDVTTIKNFRISRLNKESYLIFKFAFPPPPSKWLYEISRDDMKRPEYILFFISFVLINFVIITSFLFSSIVTKKMVKMHTDRANKVFDDIKAGGELALLDKSGFKDLDFLIDSSNSMITKVFLDIKELKEKDNDLKNLIQETSHDLKTPLTSINAIAQNLHDYFELYQKDKISKNLSTIMNEVSFMSKMIEELLFISSISIEDSEISLIDLSEMMRYEVDYLSEIKPIDMNVADNIYIKSNEIHFRRLVKNLISNAVNYSDNMVLVKLELLETSIKITVENDGQLIVDKSNYGKRRNARVIDTTDGLDISMGLGSVIISKVTSRYGGLLKIHDLDGGGTSIEVEVPI